ncbi:hypothetical protein LTR84_010001 [Exophiala bonariae]|uniref:Uncharacterized protein n=1 Tax=Exophiala bonariae TaxID=1690606 RepID=A0AAV9NLI2_9EURO|nr:hypothetical protein LTR84_010001 [Exophiala bonariae]
MSGNIEDRQDDPTAEARADSLDILTRRLEQDDRDLEEQALRLVKLREQAELDEILYEHGRAELRDQHSKLKAAQLAIHEIYISTMLSHAHNLLLMSNLGYNDEEMAFKTADTILDEVDDLIEDTNNDLSRSTLAKHAYVDGFLAEMKGNLDVAEECYFAAVDHSKDYIRLRRIQSLSDSRYAEYAATTMAQQTNDGGSETVSNRDSWLFTNLRQAAAIPSENGDTFNRCMINQVYLDTPPLGGKQSHPEAETEDRQNDDEFHEPNSRHATPCIRRSSVCCEPVVESVISTDTPQPDSLAKRPRRRTAAELRHKVPHIDTSGFGRPTESPTSPSRPSPLSRQLSVNGDITLQNEK